MKAKIVFYKESSDDFGWINLKLEPQTEEEKKCFRDVFERHQRIIENESDEDVVTLGAVLTGSEETEIEIIFPKN